MFAELDETIRRLLIREVPLDPSEIDVSFATPDREWSSRLTRPTVNCFLCDVRENVKLRSTERQVRRDSNNHVTSSRAPVRIDATYQLTTWARAAEDEHQLLWRVLSAVIRNSTIPTDLLQGNLKQQPLAIPTSAVKPDQMPANFADLWQALDNQIRPVLTYVVTLALDPEVVATSPMVLKAPVIRAYNVESDGEGVLSRIRGRVYDRQDRARRMAGALVVLQETGDRTISDDEGHFTFGGVPRGSITLVVRAAGREEATWPFRVPAPTYDVEV